MDSANCVAGDGWGSKGQQSSIQKVWNCFSKQCCNVLQIFRAPFKHGRVVKIFWAISHEGTANTCQVSFKKPAWLHAVTTISSSEAGQKIRLPMPRNYFDGLLYEELLRIQHCALQHLFRLHAWLSIHNFAWLIGPCLQSLYLAVFFKHERKQHRINSAVFPVQPPAASKPTSLQCRC